MAHINLDGEALAAAGAGAPGGWWRFDDEGVSQMKAGPCHSADHGAAVAKRPAGGGEEGGGGGGKVHASVRGMRGRLAVCVAAWQYAWQVGERLEVRFLLWEGSTLRGWLALDVLTASSSRWWAGER